jgi:choline dehydrogenase-like flavoprotein
MLGNSSLEQKKLSADVCVVGAGPAGIALAEYLSEKGKSVCLLESGPKDKAQEYPDPIVADGKAVRDKTRYRAFGGTTKFWAGRWKLLDPIDFTVRPYLPLSGWPFSREVLDPFYDEAARRFAAPGVEKFTHMTFAPKTQKLCEDGSLAPTMFWTYPKEKLDIGALHYDRVATDPNITLCLDATLTKIEKEKDRVTRVHVSSGTGKVFTVEAEHFVLAAGAIENARFLLASDLGGPATGKYITNHPKGSVAVIHPAPGFVYENEWLTRKGDGGAYRVSLGLTEHTQQSLELLNSYVQLEPIYPDTFSARLLRKIRVPGPLRHIAVVSYLEQAPLAQNKVSLLPETDALGVPRVKISWNLHPVETNTVLKLHSLLGENIKRMGMGTLDTEMLKSSPPEWLRLRDGGHFASSTRMGTDPQTSVVDRDAKVHGVRNLYVAGSSVFPTSGNANPTATFIALSLKLGEHLSHE